MVNALRKNVKLFVFVAALLILVVIYGFSPGSQNGDGRPTDQVVRQADSQNDCPILTPELVKEVCGISPYGELVSTKPGSCGAVGSEVGATRWTGPETYLGDDKVWLHPIKYHTILPPNLEEIRRLETYSAQEEQLESRDVQGINADYALVTEGTVLPRYSLADIERQGFTLSAGNLEKGTKYSIRVGKGTDGEVLCSLDEAIELMNRLIAIGGWDFEDIRGGWDFAKIK